MKKRVDGKILLSGVLAMVLVFGTQLPLGLANADVRSATITNLKGDVSVQKGDGGWETAKTGMILFKGDQLKTAEQAFAEVAIDDGKTGTVEIDSASVFKLETLDRNQETGDKITLLGLAMGRVLVHAEKLEGKSKFEVKTPTSTAGVRGTTFEVKVAEE